MLVNVNPAYRTHELSYAINQSGLSLLMAATALQDQRLPRDGRGGRRRLPDPAPHGLPRHRRPRRAGRGGAGRRARDALAERKASLDPGDPINIQYTSGTTGYPKGATLIHRNILNNGYLTTELIGFTEQDRLCIPVPFYHCFGMVMGNLGCTSHGATMVIPAPGFDPGRHAARVDDERCTALYGVPTMFIAMQSSRRSPTPTSRRCAPASWPARSARSR